MKDETTTVKPTVYYAHRTLELHLLEEGGMIARLYAMNHPRLGDGDIRTSRILSIDASTGTVETLNTIYAPIN